MSIEKYIKTQDELLEIAHALSALAQNYKSCVYRYKQVVSDSIYVDRGRKNINRCGLSSTFNLEDLDSQVYSTVRGEELFPFNLPHFEEWRRRSEVPYLFTHKGIPLPTDRYVNYRPVPTNYERWDEELLQFTREYKNERITRDFGIEQRVIINSAGGMIIESRPFFYIYYRQGYGPHMITRSLGAYVSANEEIDRIPKLIKYLPDPTPDRRINHSPGFAEAFHHLYHLSHEVVFPDPESANLSDDLTHDVIMLSGVPIHEIFGHQFEEPIYPLQVGQRSLFPIGKNVQNSTLILRDNPRQTLEGLEVCGSYHYDCYGRKSIEKTQIEDSRVHEHLGGEYIDLKNIHTFLGVDESNSLGNTRQGDEGSFPQPRMSCTILEGTAEENLDWSGKLVMVPFNGYVVDGNFFKVQSSECYMINKNGDPIRVGPLEGSRAIYDAIIGMHILPGKSHHIGSCSKPNVLEGDSDTEVMVSFFTNHQLWEHLTLRSL